MPPGTGKGGKGMTCLDCIYAGFGNKEIDLFIYCSEPEKGVFRCGKHGCLLVDEANEIRDIEPCKDFVSEAEHIKLFEPAKAGEVPF